MAILTSHTLSSVDGTHAGGVSVSIVRLAADGTRTTLLDSKTDDGGRFEAELSVGDEHAEAQYELVFGTGVWFSDQDIPRPGMQIVSDIVIRFAMPNPDGRYHIPVIIGPNGYSTWWSS